MTNESSITDFSMPIANVVCYSPDGLPTTAVNCFNVGAIVYAVEHANPADSVHVATPNASHTLADCPRCIMGVVENESEAPYCPSCARERSAK